MKMGTATSSPYHTPPESPAKRFRRRGDAVTDDDDYSEADVEVYQESEGTTFTGRSPKNITRSGIKPIIAGRQDLMEIDLSPILDSAGRHEMRIVRDNHVVAMLVLHQKERITMKKVS
jgi:hypothetical protein